MSFLWGYAKTIFDHVRAMFYLIVYGTAHAEKIFAICQCTVTLFCTAAAAVTFGADIKI